MEHWSHLKQINLNTGQFVHSSKLPKKLNYLIRVVVVRAEEAVGGVYPLYPNRQTGRPKTNTAHYHTAFNQWDIR